MNFKTKLNNIRFIYRIAIWICVIENFVSGNVQSKVRCSEETMEVDIVRSSPMATIYLEHLKNYPDENCKPKLSEGVATFRLSLLENEMLRCGLTRVVNTVTGQKVYYHRIIVEEPNETEKHKLTVKCVITELALPNYTGTSGKISSSSSSSSTNSSISINKRSLPDDFVEAEYITITEQVEVMAPVPILGAGVRQGGALVTGELNVSPGTPLQMEIYLDTDSAPTYGILATYMQVSDTKNQEETIIFNGCSVDPYLFDNFNTIDGDFLTAKFRAFKFPESSYVQFRGTVNVCLETCKGIECSNGRIGFGRKKRAISTSPSGEKNNVFEVTMSTFIKVDFEDGAAMDKALLEFVLRGKNGTDDRPVIAKEVREQFKYRVIETENAESAELATNLANIRSASIILIILSVIKILFNNF